MCLKNVLNFFCRVGIINFTICICVCEFMQTDATRNIGSAENGVTARVVQAKLMRVLFRSKVKTDLFFLNKN